MGQNLRVRSKTGSLVPMFTDNAPADVQGVYRCQFDLLRLMTRQADAGLPIRIIILKARQLGMSTVSEGLNFALAYNNAQTRAFVCAHNDASSTVLFQKNQMFEMELAKPKKVKRYSSKKEIVWKGPHYSQVQVDTAGNATIGKGDTISVLHCSEVAFWDNQAESLLSVLQAVPNRPNTIVVLESTANGVGDEFYKRWQVAWNKFRDNPEDLTGYLPLFLSWTDNPEEYSMQVPDNYNWGEMDDAECVLRDAGTTDEQMYWRRRTLLDQCGGDITRFMQEYPSTPEESFRETGSRVIPGVITKYHRKTACKPGKFVSLAWKDEKHDAVIPTVFDRHRPGLWRVWMDPNQDHDYAIGADVMEGELADKQDDKSERDLHAIEVLDRASLEQVAEFDGRCDGDILTEELLKGAYWYNRAYLCPEINKSASMIISSIRNNTYSRVYQRGGPPDTWADIMSSTKIGYRTDVQSRNWLIDYWMAAIRKDEIDEYEHCPTIYSERVVDQEETFVYDKNGKKGHRTGCHDDHLFAMMLAWVAHLRCPRTSVPRHIAARKHATMGPNFVGGYDTMADLDGGGTQCHYTT